MTQQIETTDLVTGAWSIDPSHSEVGFSVRHLMSKVKGTFADFSGTITTTSTSPVDSTVEVTIVSSSISTNNAQRDGHLKSADFFDPTNGGSLAFVSHSIREGAGGYVIAGDLTINGITKPVDLAAEFLGVAVDAYGATRLGAEAHTSIDRKDFNVTFNVPLDGGKLLIGDKVDITLAIEAVRA
ncbi:MAG TPA: YceI family protein [Microlunatus sp.]